MPMMYNEAKGKYEYVFFADRDPLFLNTLAKLLEKEEFEKGDIIIQEGDLGWNMYFVFSGKVAVLAGPEMIQVTTLVRGQHFGELALWGAAKRTATIQALEHTVCLVVKRRIFQAVLAKFPKEKEYFESVAHNRRREVHRRTFLENHKKASVVQITKAPRDRSSSISSEEAFRYPKRNPTRMLNGKALQGSLWTPRIHEGKKVLSSTFQKNDEGTTSTKLPPLFLRSVDSDRPSQLQPRSLSKEPKVFTLPSPRNDGTKSARIYRKLL